MPRFEPQPGPQTAFLSSPADIVIYGGAAGGGKTWALLLEAMRYTDVAGFTATIFRRSYPEITNLGGLWDESEKVYAGSGTPVKGELLWRWPSGAQLEFNHMQNDAALVKYDGAQFAFMGFDQLEHFSARQFWYMFTRNRSMCGVVPYIRATCNPDPDSFLVSGESGWGSGLISWWIKEDGYPDPARAGVIRYFLRRGEVLHWGDTREELIERFPGSQPKSITFIPATVYDNKKLLEVNPEYLANLEALPLVERERFLGGNWKIKAAAGKVFNRDWFKIIEPSAVPGGGVEGDGYDFAATVKKVESDDPDYSCRVKMRKVNGKFYVLDMQMERIAAGEIDQWVLQTTTRDRQIARSQGVTRFIVRWENEPGSAGLRVTNAMIRLLSGFEAAGVPITGDKLTRAKPLAAQVGAGNVYLVAGPWNDQFLALFHSFPEARHDDPIDAASVIFNVLADLPEDQQPANSAEAIAKRQAARAVFQSDY